LASVFSGVLFGVLFSQILQKNKQTVHPEDRATKPKDGSQALPPASAQVVHTEPDTNHSDGSADDVPLRTRVYEWGVSIGTLGLLVINLFLWGITKHSNFINEQALVSVQRSFVTFRQISLDAIPIDLEGIKRQWVFDAIIENSGTTPAINRVEYFTASNKLSDEPAEIQFIGEEKDRPVGEIGPKAQKTIGPVIHPDDFVLGNFSLDSIGTEDFMKSFRSKRIFFWGWVGYRDVFPDTRPHITEFCVESDGIVANLPGTTRPIHFDVKSLQPRLHYKECKQHNCTDEHCRDYQTMAAIVPK